MAKVTRVSDQNKQGFLNSINNANNSYDVNSNIQPNINPFQQTALSKEKAKLSLPVTSMGMGLKNKSTVNTPQVLKDVEKLIEQNDLKNNVKVEPTSSNTPSVTNNDTGFENIENMRFYGEYSKIEIKNENEM